MKTTKLIFKTKLLLKLLLLPVLAGVIQSCDVTNADPDIIDNTTEITGKEIYVRSNNTALIDLNAKIRSNQEVRFSVTSDPEKGELSDLGAGILQYSPTPGILKARDAFQFTVYSKNNEVLSRDSIILIIDNETDDLPCGVYPGDDYVYGINPNSGPNLIDVTANDIICTSDTVISVYRPLLSAVPSYPPYYGTAEVVGNKIQYTPASTYTGDDMIVYRITSASDPNVLSYGMVFVRGDVYCPFIVRFDTVTVSAAIGQLEFQLPLFQNDELCSLRNYTTNIVHQPVHGTLSLNSNGGLYTSYTPVVENRNDFFSYEICADGLCKRGGVELYIILNSGNCTPLARNDSAVFSSNANNVYYINVLNNDIVCDSVNLAITSQPQFGTATVSTDPTRIKYVHDPLSTEEDELEYEICKDSECTRATVSIKILP